MWFISFEKFILSLNRIKTLVKIKISEAMAWTKKYLIEDSVDLELNCLIIRGIIIIKFNSRPIHLINQEDEEDAIIVPAINKKINVIW